ncbi:MAG: hypothetical protein UU62_C0037G0005 [Candidatus Uhrbacteria bacterium GW2011_GWF2_41_40]|nr:MAG: hypothetical protein UU62_C0037G0005 [Candidatus Uhrbacteria bacterium GW2011_GWF2_41_40]
MVDWDCVCGGAPDHDYEIEYPGDRENKTKEDSSTLVHTVFEDSYFGREIIVVKCGNIEVNLEQAPKYCPNCGENIEEEVAKLETPRS